MKTEKEIRELLLRGEKADLECKTAERKTPKSIYESYSAFANTNGGIILLGVSEDKYAEMPQKKYVLSGVENTDKIITDFWNTINGNKVNANILKDEDVYSFDIDGVQLVVIEVPRADYVTRPVYIGDNPFKGSFKRNHEGDYHCAQAEVRAMIRDENEGGNDGLIMENYTMDDIDDNTLHQYRNRFRVVNEDNVWNNLEDKEFLEMLGGYRYDRQKKVEGLTLAGLLMFGKGYPIRDKFDMINMDYREETDVNFDVRWNDRITYDGTWENNLYTFIQKVMPKLTSELPRPFKLEGVLREDDTPQHKACREAMINMIIHADFQGEGTLKVIKRSDAFEFSNPGTLKLPKELIYKGGNSKARNPKMQTMLRMIGYGDTAGSGFPTILSAWSEKNWPEPELFEDTVLNQVTLTLKHELGKESIRENNSTTKETATATKENGTTTKETAKKTVGTTKETKKTTKENTKEVAERIMEILRENPKKSAKEIADYVGMTPDGVRYHLNKLKKEGLLHHKGPTKGGYWLIDKDR
ncbi:MAG: putative DNA binding domain-containing protein [Lachnospiraceae bacterium]|nr:putative DNA binding domain-containing protein [Lachnospiraceae bacterium]